eukprot:gene14527-20558_t
MGWLDLHEDTISTLEEEQREQRTRQIEVGTYANLVGFNGPLTEEVDNLGTKMCVIGAGAAGLVAAKELQAEGHHVVVMEQSPVPGGVWVYDDCIETDDIMGAQSNRKRVHGSMYRNLRTNLPREIMGYTDFPFIPEMMGTWSKDGRRYCGHEEVRAYLDAYAAHFDLHGMIRLNTQVLHVDPINSAAGGHITVNGAVAASPGITSSGPRWRVVTSTLSPHDNARPSTTQAEELFDAVVVANGHYHEPNLPSVAGMDSYAGLQMHSHNYREPNMFKDKVVLVVGASNSGDDIAREVSTVSDKVLLSARTWKAEQSLGPDSTPFGSNCNIYRYPLVESLTPEGMATFPAGVPAHAVDAIIYATGYKYSFPFLQTDNESPPLVSSEQSTVEPLYQHMFPPEYAPWISFMGIPWKVVPFPMCEFQTKWIARLLSGRVELPSVEEMRTAIQAMEDKRAREGIPERWTHMMGEAQWEYFDWLSEACGGDVPPLPAWRTKMYAATSMNKKVNTDSYRNGPWVEADHKSLQEAGAEMDAIVQSSRTPAARL